MSSISSIDQKSGFDYDPTTRLKNIVIPESVAKISLDAIDRSPAIAFSAKVIAEVFKKARCNWCWFGSFAYQMTMPDKVTKMGDLDAVFDESFANTVLESLRSQPNSKEVEMVKNEFGSTVIRGIFVTASGAGVEFELFGQKMGAKVNNGIVPVGAGIRDYEIEKYPLAESLTHNVLGKVGQVELYLKSLLLEFDLNIDNVLGLIKEEDPVKLKAATRWFKVINLSGGFGKSVYRQALANVLEDYREDPVASQLVSNVRYQLAELWKEYKSSNLKVGGMLDTEAGAPHQAGSPESKQIDLDEVGFEVVTAEMQDDVWTLVSVLNQAEQGVSSDVSNSISKLVKKYERLLINLKGGGEKSFFGYIVVSLMLNRFLYQAKERLSLNIDQK